MATLLMDSELESVVGGVGEKTGDMKNGEVYITFPFPFLGYSGFYGCDAIEQLALENAKNDNILKIKKFITNDIRTAITNLYAENNRIMPENIKNILGL